MTSPRDGNRVRLLQCGVEFFPALEQAIDAAVRDVWLETYIFADDDTGRRIAAALARAAQRGVAVHVVYDGFGSAGHIGALGAWLSSQGVEVAVFRAETTWNKLRRSRLRRLHRKLAMIDARVAFVGGINIIDDLNMPEPRHPRYDFAVAVEGPIMMPIHAAMAALWLRLHQQRIEQWRDALAAFPPEATAVGDQHAWFAFRDNVHRRRDIEREYLAAILGARSEILIANAYFFPGRRFRRALLRARRRGVRVRLLLQGRQEYVLQHYATRALYGVLLEAGVEIHEYAPSFLHAKVAVIDGRWATVGSSNIDPFSLLLAREANVFVRDDAFAARLHASLVHAIRFESVSIQHARWSQRPWPDRLLTWLLYGMARGLMSVLGYGRH
ncbi:MAG: cardiolipin synthase ClsB [Burkholderiales bacterium]|nr:cardiolipin synthase ClsB [Burkholderiales bacterium]